MRKFVIAAALAASALTAAAPAAAQWYPPQGNAYGYNDYGQVRYFQARVDRLHQRIHHLQGRLSRGEFLALNRDVDQLQYRIRRASYRGIGHEEARDLNRRIDRLERTIYREARDGRGYDNHHGYQNGYYQSGWDRDRDGLDDRYERDHGGDYDEDHDRD